MLNGILSGGDCDRPLEGVSYLLREILNGILLEESIGTAGLQPLYNQIGDVDMFGNVLEVTEPAVADELAAGASLVMGQAAEACPVVLARGACLKPADVGSDSLLRDKSLDMFR